MKKTLKGPAVAFFVLSLAFTLGWIAVFLFHGLSGLAFDFEKTLNEWILPHLENIPKLVLEPTLFGWLPEVDGVAYPTFYYTYIAVGTAGIMAILIVVGIVVAIVRKRARYIPFALVMLAAAFTVVEFMANITYYLPHLTFTPAEETLGNTIFSFSTVGCAGLAYIFSILTFFFGLAHAKRLLAQPEVEPEDDEEEEEEAEEKEEKPENAEWFNENPLEEQQVQADQVEEVKTEDYDTLSDFQIEPEEQVAQPEEVVVEEVPEDNNSVTKDDLAAILKDVVRDIVRDEIARANAAKEEQRHEPTYRDGDHSITGATFGGPLVVQYFNGGINGQTGVPTYAPAPQPTSVVVNNPAPVAPAAPKKEEPKKEEPKKEEPAPVAVAPVEVSAEEEQAKNPIIRIPFTERMLDAEKDMKDNYNELKNEILSYGVNSRVSNSGDTFRLHRKTYVKITIAGKSLKLYFALNPADYADSKMPIGDASQHAVYAEIPLIFKVKSGLSLRRAKELIRDVMTQDGLTQGEVESVNWVKELKAAAK